MLRLEIIGIRAPGAGGRAGGARDYNAAHKILLKKRPQNAMFRAPFEEMSGRRGEHMAKTSDTDTLAVELKRLLELNASERVSRNRCFDKFSTPFGRRLFAYYRTCMSLKKEIEDPKRDHRIRMKARGEQFTLEIINDPIAYRRTATLPNEVRPFFEGVIRSGPKVN
jgi:hypothetical protein